MRWLAFLLFICSFACKAATQVRVIEAAGTRLRVQVVDVDDPARVDMLQRWVAEVAASTRTASGRFPLREAYVRVQQIDSRDDSPVPWGQTQRRGEVGVLLYVRRDADYDALRQDWTATHELAHLFHPYLGDSGRWLAEGLASYYQNVFRARAGVLTPMQAWERLDAGFRRGAAASPDRPLDAMGRGRGGTMRVYWGGAAYWMEADLALRANGKSLDAVLDEYARCCLVGTDSPAPSDYVAELDRIAGGRVFADLYARYSVSRTFPALEDAYRRLGLTRTSSGLRAGQDPVAMRLREAIMTPPALTT